MKSKHGWLLVALCAAFWFAPLSARALTITIDYKYDATAFGGTNFFGSGHPQGATAGSQAKTALNAAAAYFSDLLSDNFSAINVPSPYQSSVSDGRVVWGWKQFFSHPTSGAQVEIVNPSIPAGQYIVYAGARNFGGNTAGQGGVGWYSLSKDLEGTNSFSPSDIANIDAIHNTFVGAVERRGEPTGFAAWGGSISFDQSSRVWHSNHTTLPSGNVTDFYSVAIHELAHALGFGGSEQWQALISGSTFTGTTARAANGGVNVPLSPNLDHWVAGKQSVVYGTSTPQEAAMDPDLTSGTRKHFTKLDAAAMTDIGWSVVPPAPLFGDYNNNGIVDAADYTVWRKLLLQNVTIPNDQSPGTVQSGDYSVWRANYGNRRSATPGAAMVGVPEPGAVLLAMIAASAMAVARRNRRR